MKTKCLSSVSLGFLGDAYFVTSHCSHQDFLWWFRILSLDDLTQSVVQGDFPKEAPNDIQ